MRLLANYEAPQSMHQALCCAVGDRTDKGPVKPPRVRLSTTGTHHLGKAFGCVDVRGIQMSMTVLSSCRKISWPQGRTKTVHIHMSR